MNDAESPSVDDLVGCWKLRLVSAKSDSREVNSPVEIEFDDEGCYVIRSSASATVEGTVEQGDRGMVRTVASGVNLPARALRVDGDRLIWTMSDGADLVFTRHVTV